MTGNSDTYGGEGVVSMLYDRYSLSAGAFHFETDGWRPNYDVNDDIYNVLGQAAITPKLNAQVEFRHRDLNQGDLAFNFDPDNFSDSRRRDLDQDIARAGLRYSPTPRSDFLFSFIYNDREETGKELLEPDFELNFGSSQQTRYQVDGQYLYRRHRFTITTGFGYSDAEEELRASLEELGFPVFIERGNINHPRGYLYANMRLPDPVVWTVGVSYDDYKDDRTEDALQISQANPKFGVQWNITDDVRLRAAAFRTVKPALVNNRTLEPTQVAGFKRDAPILKS